MKKHPFIICMIIVFAAEIMALLIFIFQAPNTKQDAVAVNEALHTVQADWYAIQHHKNQTDLDYAVLDRNGTVVFKTSPEVRDNVYDAVTYRDTVLDIEIGGLMVGKMIVYNNSMQLLYAHKQTAAVILAAAIVVQCGICMGYLLYINNALIKPFHKLNDFARRIAGGNLEIPLQMDKNNLFGAFTESFDIMRSELKKARLAEAQANTSKKELVAKLSHDIKTPVASIKAVSEIGAALAADEKAKDNYTKIIRKADQINTLVTNLFSATMEELKQLTVTVTDIESSEIKIMLDSADYLHRANIPDMPACLILGDKLRLQQIFDNIFVNSYKYANTGIFVSAVMEQGCLAIRIEDFGGGVQSAELPLLKEKYKRGSNAEQIEGAGLGLYISDYFMKEMHGKLLVNNGKAGLCVTVVLPLSGTI